MAALKTSLGLRAALLSLLILVGILAIWQVATMPTAASGPAMDPEYAKLMGAAAVSGSKSSMPTPADIGATRCHEALVDDQTEAVGDRQSRRRRHQQGECRGGDVPGIAEREPRQQSQLGNIA